MNNLALVKQSPKQSSIMKIVDSFENLPVVKCRAMFDTLETELFKLPQIEEEDYLLEEYMSGGLYCRKISIPPGALITGKIYKFDHIETMISGEIVIISADGPKKTYEGFNVIEAKSGKRQAGLAIKETIWMTVNHVPENMLIKDMLKYCTVSNYDEYHEFYRDLNTLDYNLFLREMGINQAQMDELVNADEYVDIPNGFEHIHTKDSLLEGVGLFTNKEIKKGDIVCPARVLDKRTTAGRFSNHALYANSEPYNNNGVFCFIAKKNINAGDEITTNYREVLNFRFLQGDLLCQDG